MKKILIILTLSLFAVGYSQKKKDLYLFTSFREPATEGLYLAYSEDGYNWKGLEGSFLKPEIGASKIMRDPSITKGADGTYHMVWTTDWKGGNGFGYASSKDLIHWSKQEYIPVMKNEPEVVNVWAPEIFYDDVKKEYIIIWASTIPFRFEKGVEDEKNNHRMYYVTTKDFKTFSDTKLYFEPGFSVIDCAILEKDGQYYMFLKNENSNPPEKNIRLTSASQPFDFPTEVSASITRNYWAEGPAPLRVGDSVYVYFDKYTEKKYGAVRSKDLKVWDDVSDEVTFPKGIRHGTAFAVSKKVLEGLKK